MIATLDGVDIELLPFGVIGFDDDYLVRLYNKVESMAAGLSPERVLGQHVFETVAPCMNNFLVAQKFVDAEERSAELDESIDYVLTLRMKPTRVRMRLVQTPGARYRYILIWRTA